jgi:hypothetical protein
VVAISGSLLWLPSSHASTLSGFIVNSVVRQINRGCPIPF